MPRGINFKKIGEALAAGSTKGDALIAGGYSNTTAKRGVKGLSEERQALIDVEYTKALKKNARHLIAASQEHDTEALRHLARGRLIENTIAGKDDGIQSAKTIANLDETGMIKPQIQQGVIIIQAAKLPSFEDCPRLPEGPAN